MSGKVKNSNYIQIGGWMVNELGLKGNELLIFAIIYGFSQDGETRFTGSLKYLCEWTQATKPSVIKHLKSLVNKGLIVKCDKYINEVKFCEYYVPINPETGEVVICSEETAVKKFNQGGKEILPGAVKKFNQGGKEILPNNTIDNNNKYNTNNKKEGADAPHTQETKVANKKFVPPTIEEVRSYCMERGNNIDPEYFVSYYEARGWELSKGRKVKDWKACVRTWEHREFNSVKGKKPELVKNDRPATMEELKAIAMGYYED